MNTEHPTIQKKTTHAPDSTQAKSQELVKENFKISLEHIPAPEEVIETLGSYQLLKTLGQGGMGAVFLAYDTLCGRYIALKRIKSNLTKHQIIRERFLRESRLTSQLAHPTIIPIYAIHCEESEIYYTMPYVAGETFKQLLKEAKKQLREEGETDTGLSNIYSLLRVFLSICQGVSYAHSRGVLHRDLKPENIMIGRYGEVFILDWGLAHLLASEEQAASASDEKLLLCDGKETEMEAAAQGLTVVGKILGTVAYLAPERALGKPASIQTDIYALGVILYQILTLKMPFKRGTIAEFRKTVHLENFIDPSVVAPYGDVPRILCRVVKKCLEPQPEDRYQKVEQLIQDVATFTEGHSEWFALSHLNRDVKSDWQFQEHILWTQYAAIARSISSAEWLTYMLSKQSFIGNTMIEAKVRLKGSSNGLGFLISMTSRLAQHMPNEGYGLWLGSVSNPGTNLYRSSVVVHTEEQLCLMPDQWYEIQIKKIDNNIYFSLNGEYCFSYISHLPLRGQYVGLFYRDTDFEIVDFKVSIGAWNIKVNCLAIPDAFLSNHNYEQALIEYRRISKIFTGCKEEREALFNAGRTLLEQALLTDDARQKSILFELALEEFEELRNTTGAPLEYLGKAMVYQALREYDEEDKCFELACRKYKNHPLLSVLYEKLVYRIYDHAQNNRKGVYELLLIVAHLIPHQLMSLGLKNCMSQLLGNWEPLYFLPELNLPADYSSDKSKFRISFVLHLATWLARPHVVEEVIEGLLRKKQVELVEQIIDAVFVLLAIGAIEQALKQIDNILEHEDFNKESSTVLSLQRLKKIVIGTKQQALSLYLELEEDHFAYTVREIVYIMEWAVLHQNFDLVIKIYQKALSAGVFNCSINSLAQDLIQSYYIAALCCTQCIEEGKALLTENFKNKSIQDDSLLNFMQGIFLSLYEGLDKGLAFYEDFLPMKYPYSSTLGGHFLVDRLTGDGFLKWEEQSFLLERRALYLQLFLFYKILNQVSQAQDYYQQANQEYYDVQSQ